MNRVCSCPEAAFRFASTGVFAVAAEQSFAIAGLSCSRKPGKRARVVFRFACWVAVSVAALSASTMKSWTCVELLASAVITELELAVSALSVWESFPSRLSRLSVSSSAGTARWSAVWRSVERPATAAPSSLMINVNRSRCGIRMMSASRSAGIVENVCDAPQRAARGKRLAVLAGLAVDEVLADQRLRPRLARRVRAERAEPLDGHLHRDQRVELVLAVGVLVRVTEVDRRDRPGRDTRDLERRAGHEPERVVELELVGRVARPARKPAGDHDERRRARARSRR